MTLLEVQEGEEYIIKDIQTDDEEMDAFLFTLGCYSGEPITVVSRKKKNCVVSIKDGRYNIDNFLAEAIIVQQETRQTDNIRIQQQQDIVVVNITTYILSHGQLKLPKLSFGLPEVIETTNNF